jgi:putative ABC transport system permease protein
MQSVLLVAWSNLRRRRGQAVLVGLIIGLSALVFFTGVGVLREIERPFGTMFARQAGSHFTMIFDTRIHDPDSVRAWWTRHDPGAVVSEATPTVALTDRAFVRGAAISRFLFVTERPLATGGPDSLRFVAGSPRVAPRPGEVWIPTSLAYEANIQPGDTLGIPAADGLMPLMVSAVVVDPVFSASLISPTRVWLAPGELPAYFSASVLDRVIVGVRLSALERRVELWKDFVRDQGGAFSGFTFNYEDVRNGYIAPYTLLAALVLAFSVLGFGVALFAIQGTITSAMLADYRMIGILRTQGFTPRDVRRIYELQYLVLAGIALVLGVGLGYVTVRGTVSLLTRAMATPVPPGSLLGLAALTLAGFLGLVYGFVVFVARAAGRVKPAEAIRSEGRSLDRVASGLSLTRFARIPVPWLIGIRNLGLQRRRAVFLTIAIVFATLAASLAVNLDHTISGMQRNLAIFGLDGATIRVSRSGRRLQLRHEALMSALREWPGVRAVATWDLVDGQLLDSAGLAGRPLLGNVVDGDMNGLGYLNLRGRNPAGASEIALGVRTAETAGRHLGDRVEMIVMGARLSFTVVGIFQSLNNTGDGFRIRLAAVHLANPLWTPVEYGLVLADSVPPERVMADLEAEYGEAVDAKPADYFLHDQLASVISGQRMANGFLAVIFLAAAAVFIVNTTLLTIGENRRVFGILKTTGMTPAELRLSVVSAVAVQTVVGVALGLLVWVVAAKSFLSLLFRGVGLVDFPLRNSLVGTAIAVVVIVGASLTSAWIPSTAVLDVNPRSLIVE